MFSFFHLEIGHSVNRKTVSLLAFFRFSALSSCSFFRFIWYLFRSASLSLFLFFLSSFLHTLYIRLPLILQLRCLRVLCAITLCCCQSFGSKSCVSSRWVLRWALPRIFRSYPINYLEFYGYERTVLYLRARTTTKRFEYVSPILTKIDLREDIIKILLGKFYSAIFFWLVCTHKKEKSWL